MHQAGPIGGSSEVVVVHYDKVTVDRLMHVELYAVDPELARSQKGRHPFCLPRKG